MIKKIIILMFVLFMSINISYAEIITYDTFEFFGSSQSQQMFGSTDNLNLIYYINNVYINDIVTLQSLNSIIWEVETSSLRGNNLISEYDTSIILTIDGDTVGSGIFGYNSVASTGKTYIQLHIWETEGLNIGSKTGSKVMSMSSNSVNDLYLYGIAGFTRSGLFPNSPPNAGTGFAFFGMSDKYCGSGHLQTSNITINTDYEQSMIFNYTDANSFNIIEMDRDVSNQTIAIITINDNIVYDDITLKTTNFQYLDYNKLNYSIDISMENVFGDIVYKNLIFSYTPPVSSATIELNQSSYTSPEFIKSDITLNNPDYTNNYYRIKTMYSLLDDNYNYASVNYNQTQLISTDESSYLITLNEEYYNLPIKIMVTVEQYNKNSGVTTVIGESNKVLYNPSAFYDFIYDGYVLDVTNNAYISNTDIYFDNGINNISITSNNQGYFKIYLGIDNYNVTASHINYNTWDYDDVFINQAQSTNIYLTPLISGVNLYGSIFDLSNTLPLSNVKITVSNNTFSTYVYSNNYGYFEVLNIANDENYTVITEYEGYYNYNELIEIDVSNTTYLSIMLVSITYDDDVDEDIGVIVDELKEGLQPFKDLIFGLSEIVIDNPDYNDDNIISQNEYSTWINSFISIAIVIFIIIMYVGLKDRRGER